MQTYDLCMLLVLGGAAVFGAWKGLAWQVASLASFVVSYFAALQFREPLAPYFGQEAPLNRFAAMLAIYCGCSLVIWLLFRGVADFIDRVKLKEFDRQLGAVFGLGKGVLLCTVITFFVVTLSPTLRDDVLHSQSGHYIARFIDGAEGIMPHEVRQVLAPYLHKLDQQLDPNQPPATPYPPAWPQPNGLQPNGLQPNGPAWPQPGQPWQPPPAGQPWPQPNPAYPVPNRTAEGYPAYAPQGGGGRYD